MSRVLADTGPLYALADSDDQYHRRAVVEAEVLTQSGTAILVPYPILMEGYTLVLRRLGGSAARRWLVEVSMGAGLVNPLAGDFDRARELLGRFVDQPITLFDATLAVLAETLDHPVWTFDHHFDVMRTAVWR